MGRPDQQMDGNAYVPPIMANPVKTGDAKLWVYGHKRLRLPDRRSEAQTNACMGFSLAVQVSDPRILWVPPDAERENQ